MRCADTCSHSSSRETSIASEKILACIGGCWSTFCHRFFKSCQFRTRHCHPKCPIILGIPAYSCAYSIIAGLLCPQRTKPLEFQQVCAHKRSHHGISCLGCTSSGSTSPSWNQERRPLLASFLPWDHLKSVTPPPLSPLSCFFCRVVL